MAKSNSILVRVPASTANLGPGFDCLGLALDIWNDIEFSFSGDSLNIEIEGEGCESLPRDSSNLVYQSMLLLLKSTSYSLPKGIQIKCSNNIPVSSGLGSSAAAVIAGLLGAKTLLNIQINDFELLKLAMSYEGHADNISACLCGGLTISALSAGELVIKKLSLEPLNAIIALPDIKISTPQARAVLPESVSMKDAVFNIGRVALLVNSFQEGNYEYLKIAMQDSIHQHYRLGLYPGSEAAITGALDAGALGAALSGAGPSVIAFMEKDDQYILKKISEILENAFFNPRIFSTVTTNHGAYVQRH